MTDRFTVQLKNFSEFEADCSCGCGLGPDPELMLRLQAFLLIIERIYNCQVRCHITGPVRCIKHNTAEYGGKETPSYHCGLSKGKKKDPYGAAVDVRIELFLRGEWVALTKDTVAQMAIDSRLFGGVGWKIYGPAKRFVHLDIGPVRTF